MKVCPSCGGTEWTIDYDETPSGEEVPVNRCDNCEWPPNTPMSPDEWRRHREAQS